MLLKYLQLPAIWLAACVMLPPIVPAEAQDVSFTELVLVYERTEDAPKFQLPEIYYGEAFFINLGHDMDFDIVASGRTSDGLTFYTANGQREGYVAGDNPYWRRISRISENESLATWKGDAVRGDFNHDGQVDFTSLGWTRTEFPLIPQLKTWTSETASTTTGTYNGAVSAGDYDNDGAVELVASGIGRGQTGYLTTISEFDSSTGNWTAVPTNLPQLAYSTSSWIDFDGDSDLDLFLAGRKATGESVADIFENQQGSLIPMGLDFPALIYGSADWGDYDQDGDPDLVYAGGAIDPRYKLRARIALFENESGNFSEVDTNLPGVMEGGVRWGDADNDGDLDLFLTGSQWLGGPPIAQLYIQENGDFSRSTGLPAGGRSYASIDLGDYDLDGDLDLLISGEISEEPSIHMYRNESDVSNEPPTAPAGLSSVVTNGTVRLTWQAAADDRTPSESLTYNVRVGTSSGAIDVVAPVADPQSGRRWIPAPGNSGLSTTHEVRSLPSGTYYWSVQALDTSFRGSPFAPEGTFIVP